MSLSKTSTLNYSYVYRDAINGKYGRELMNLLLSDNTLVLDIDPCAYVCPKCGHRSDSMVLDVYKDITKLVYKYKHICYKCKSVMVEDLSVIY